MELCLLVDEDDSVAMSTVSVCARLASHSEQHDRAVEVPLKLGSASVLFASRGMVTAALTGRLCDSAGGWISSKSACDVSIGVKDGGTGGSDVVSDGKDAFVLSNQDRCSSRLWRVI